MFKQQTIPQDVSGGPSNLREKESSDSSQASKTRMKTHSATKSSLVYKSLLLMLSLPKNRKGTLGKNCKTNSQPSTRKHSRLGLPKGPAHQGYYIYTQWNSTPCYALHSRKKATSIGPGLYPHGNGTRTNCATYGKHARLSAHL